MKRSRSTRARRSTSRQPKVRYRGRNIPVTSAALILASQSPAFARTSGTTRAQETTQSINAVPLLGPAETAALAVTIATVGAYRLRKARQRDAKAKREGNGP